MILFLLPSSVHMFILIQTENILGAIFAIESKSFIDTQQSMGPGRWSACSYWRCVASSVHGSLEEAGHVVLNLAMINFDWISIYDIFMYLLTFRCWIHTLFSKCLQCLFYNTLCICTRIHTIITSKGIRLSDSFQPSQHAE